MTPFEWIILTACLLGIGLGGIGVYRNMRREFRKGDELRFVRRAKYPRNV